MPHQERRYRYQRAVLWTKAGQDRHNEPILNTPQEIFVRYLVNRRESLDSKGNSVLLEGELVVDQEVPIDSLVWLAPDPGTDAVQQWYQDGSVGADTELLQTVTYEETPDLKDRASLKEVSVKRFRNTLP